MDTTTRPNTAAGGVRSSRTMYWAIARHQHSRLDVLTAQVCGGNALPVFSSREEAESFLRSYAAGEWEVRPTGVGELISLLSDPYRDAARVVLDPSPGAMDGTFLGLIGVSRQVFLDSLLGRGRGWFEDTRPNPRTGRPARNTA